MCQKKQAQISYDNNHNNTSRLDYDYQVSDKIILINKADFKYKISYKGPYEIIQMCTNDIFTLQMGTTMDNMNTHKISPYKLEEGA